MARDGYVQIAGWLTADEAELLRGLLESAGVEPIVEDAALSALNPLLQSAVGGAKVLVPAADGERAAAIARESGVVDRSAPAEPVEIPEEEWSRAGIVSDASSPVEADREALSRRALAVSLSGFLLCVTVVVPLFGLVLAVRFWATAGSASRSARVRAAAALAVGAVSLLLAAVLWTELASRRPERPWRGAQQTPLRLPDPDPPRPPRAPFP